MKYSILLCMFLSTLSYADTWVTLKNVDVDRCASAWLIKRFIDPTPEFIFFEQGDEPPEGTGYDFFGAKYFHKGADCTFTTLIKTYGLSHNKALQRINNDVNDVFAWRWRPGTFPVKFREHIGELRQRELGDMSVYEDIYVTLDLLYLSYGGEFKSFCFRSNALQQTLFLRTIMPIVISNVEVAENKYYEDSILANNEPWQNKLPAFIQNISSHPDENWYRAIDNFKANYPTKADVVSFREEIIRKIIQ